LDPVFSDPMFVYAPRWLDEQVSLANLVSQELPYHCLLLVKINSR